MNDAILLACVVRFPPQAPSVKRASPTTSRQNWPVTPASLTVVVEGTRRKGQVKGEQSLRSINTCAF